MSLEIKSITGVKRALEDPQESGLATKQARYAPELEVAINFFETGIERFRAQDGVSALQCFEQALKLPFVDKEFRAQILAYKGATLCEFIKKAPLEMIDKIQGWATTSLQEASSLSKDNVRLVKIQKLQGEIYFESFFGIKRSSGALSSDLLEKSIKTFNEALILNEGPSKDSDEDASIKNLLGRSESWLLRSRQ